MNLELHSRTIRIGGPELAPGCGYRDIVIHEMTESEIKNLKDGWWVSGIGGFVVGAVTFIAIDWWGFFSVFTKYCHLS